MFNITAHDDFWRAYRRSFWRKLASWIEGSDNNLLPYHEIREKIPFQGQVDRGVQTIPLEKIVGSAGRYRDFDRAFLPTQKSNSQRWINISTARYAEIELPAIDVYKIGDVYFVKDGNHRVSVARQRGQAMIDAYVTEIEIPINLTADTAIDELHSKLAYAEFMQQTNLLKVRPDADLEMLLTEQYGRLLNHINTHRYYLGLEQQHEVDFETAVTSWYDNVYQPLVASIKSENLTEQFPHLTITDLYWMVSEYQWLRRESSITEDKVEQVSQEMTHIYKVREVRQTIRKLRQANWIDEIILLQEKANFYDYTKIKQLRPDANLELTLPGKYEKMLAHISEHRWYLGERRKEEVPYEEAVASWYDHIYLHMIKIIREQGFLERFPGRTEADLYLWTLDHREDMREAVNNLPINS
ncbi:MAG: hypothetical protein DWQ04_34640 [Chloroflexi bacterium]|nr:MAG: hypothetical protein DWQ04_34640 [Chloroflexota bacterium]